jgi:NAD(P)-dependent dehydrogenase (short-subunit alcohol dehydrogenase family)
LNADYFKTLFGLDGKVALITGASGGIGKSLAHGLAMAGATVAVTGRDAGKLEQLAGSIREAGGKAEAFAADLTHVETVGPLVASVVEQLGRVDVLVNCLGVNKREPVFEVTPETYDWIMNVNLKGVYFLSQAVAAEMAKRGEGGRIVHIGSVNAAIGLQDISVYGLTKAALVQNTKVMAVEWAEHGIRVNCLCPGFIETELTRVGLWQNEKRSDWIMRRLCIKRPGQPEDLVGLCLYLSSPAAEYTTGQAFYVDGGLLAGSPW